MDENNKEYTSVPPAGEQISFEQTPPVEIPPVEIPQAESVQNSVPQAVPEQPQAGISAEQNTVPQTEPLGVETPQQQYYQQTPPQQNYQQTPPPTGGYQNQYQYQQAPPMAEPDTTPMTMGNWLVTLLLMVIPCVNIILLFVWAFGDKTGNLNRKNFAKAQLILLGIVLAFYIFILIIMAVVMAAMY